MNGHRHPPTLLPTRFAGGFTLIELMMVVALLAVLASLAAPSFSDTLRRYRVDSVAEGLTASLAHARAEALRHGRQVTVRRVEPCLANVLPGDWRCGWIAFVDLDVNEKLDPADTVVLEVDAHPSVHVRGTGLPNAQAYVTVSRFGLFSIDGLRVFPEGQDPDDAGPLTDNRRICLWGSRIRIQKGGAVCTQS